MGIQGNEIVDIEARRASSRPPEFIPIPFRNWYPAIRRRTKELESTMEKRAEIFTSKSLLLKSGLRCSRCLEEKKWSLTDYDLGIH